MAADETRDEADGVSGTVVSVLAFVVLGLAVVVLEASARLMGRPASLPDAVAAAMRTTPGRVAVLASWLWIGVHVLAR